MILTLTPNPSIDRTMSLAGELMRGQVQRVDSVTSQGGGKGVNISRASVSAGQPTLAVLPAAKDDPFVIELLAAGIDCRPVRPAGRRPRQHHHHRARRHHHQAQLPRRHRRRRCTSTRWPTRCMARRRDGRLGRAGGVAAARRAAGVLRRRSYAACAAPCAKVAVDTSEAPLRALVDALPGVGTAPDEAQRRGARLLHRRRRRRAGGRPAARRGRRADARRPRRRGRPGDARRRRRRARHRARAPGTPLPHRPPSCSTVGAGDSSLFGYLLGDIRGLRRRSASPSPWPTAAPPLPCPAPRSPSRRTSAPSSSPSPPWEAPHDRSDHHRPGARSTPTWGDDKHDVIRGLAAVVADAGRAADAERSSPTPSPARRPPRPACPAASPSRTAAPPASTSRRWPSPGSRRRSTSAPRTARPTWRS